jgi:hypothetical protein
MSILAFTFIMCIIFVVLVMYNIGYEGIEVGAVYREHRSGMLCRVDNKTWKTVTLIYTDKYKYTVSTLEFIMSYEKYYNDFSY